jgi:tripartite-type tricarboxylate transporter receptor subunit TctC
MPISVSKWGGKAGARILAIALSGIAACGLGTSAARAEWPERTVTIIVPYAAGGNTDVMARIAAEEFQKAFGQSFIIENVLGAGGAVAAQRVARSAPDGYTLMFASTAQFAVAPAMQKVTYDPLKDFIPIAVFGSSFSILAVNAALPVKTLPEFVDYAKKHPGALNYGSGGAGTIGHLTTAAFAKRAGLDLVHVPYRGGAQATSDLLSGQINIYFGNSIELLPHQNGDKIRLLAVATDKRVSQAPNLPTVSEFYPGFYMPAWNGLLAPANTPAKITDALAAQMKTMLSRKETIDRLLELGVVAGGPSKDEFRKYMVGEQASFGTVIKETGLSAN